MCTLATRCRTSTAITGAVDNDARHRATPVMTLPGFPSWPEAAARYEEKSGVSLQGLDFYTVLAHFKLGVILENMYKRFLGGGTVGTGFEMIGQQAVLLGKNGLDVADASSIATLRAG